MFEHSIYDQEPAEPSLEGDLFNKYEIRNWEIGPRIYRILSISAAANILALLFVAQTSLLTMKGCNSPLVSNVCQVLDTVYMGSLLFGTDRQYVDQAYEKTDLANADITFVDVSSVTPPLYYPSDYLKYSDPDKYEILQQQANDPMLSSLPPNYLAPGIPMSRPFPSSSLLNTKPITPKRNNNVVAGDLPTDFGNSDTGSNPTVNSGKKPGNGKTANVPKNDDKTTPEVNPTDAVNAVVINRRPLSDFGKTVADKIDKKEVDVNSNFKVVTIGVLTKDGKLDTSIDKRTKQPKSRIVVTEGDAKMVAVVTDSIKAISDSGWLGYLSTVGINKINFTFSQNDDQLIASITTDQLTPERANTLSTQLNGMMSAAKLLDKTGVKKLGDDERALLEAATAGANGKQVVLNFVLPKPVAQDMIRRNVQKAREDQTGAKPNGLVTGASPDNHAGK